MARKLIVNADGFGFTYGNNRGILETLEIGIVKSISVNVNFPAVEEIHTVVEKFPRVSIGIHLNLTVGKPVSAPSKIPSLVDDDGCFFPSSRFKKMLLMRKIKKDDIKRELEAQIEKLLSMSVNITHWDSHQNQHLNPGFFSPAIEVVQKYKIQRMRTHRHYLLTTKRNRKSAICKYYANNPKTFVLHGVARYLNRLARKKGVRMADRILSPGRVDNMKKFQRETWENLFRTLPEGINEVYCHPGYPDDCLRKYATYTEERDSERIILTDIDLLKFALDCSVELISFNDI